MTQANDILLTVIVVAHNEADTIAEILQKVVEVEIDKEIIVLDNASTDGTREIIQGLNLPGLRTVLQPRNIGKGHAVKEGIRLARGKYVVVQDADLEYDPRDFVPLLEAVQRPEVLAVSGSRWLGLRRNGKQLTRTAYNVGRNLIDGFFRLLYCSNLTDVSTCYKMVSVDVLRSLELRGDGFDLDFELPAKLVRRARQVGKRIVEVPIAYYPRTIVEGKKIRWWHGLQAIGTLLKYRFWR